MLFKEFVEKCNFVFAVTQAKAGNGNFPMVSNVGPKILNSLRREARAAFEPKDIRARLLELCCREYMPMDLSYYLVDDIVLDLRENGELLLRWFSQLGEQTLDIAVFQLVTKKVSLCGQSMTFVEDIQFISAIQDDIAEAVLDVVAKQNATGHDLFERWCFASNEWREDHLICPVCGSPISAYRGDKGMVHADCNSCDWEAKKQYYCTSELAQIPAMKAERKLRKKELEKVAAYKDLHDKMVAQIQTFGLAAIHESPKSNLFSRYQRGIREAQEQLWKIEESMKAKEQKR